MEIRTDIVFSLTEEEKSALRISKEVFEKFRKVTGFKKTFLGNEPNICFGAEEVHITIDLINFFATGNEKKLQVLS